jgi:hypothetical protein
MNCRPGDLALVVGGLEENIGTTVRVIRAEPPPHRTSEVDVWLVDKSLVWIHRRWRTVSLWFLGELTIQRSKRFKQPYAPDNILMPLRPPGEKTETEMRTEVLTFNPDNIKVRLHG